MAAPTAAWFRGIILKVIVIALVALVLSFVAFSFYVSQPVVEGTRGGFKPVIADRADALTFGRSAEGLILVTQHEGDALIGVNLTKRFGGDKTADLIAFVADLDQTTLPDENAISERFPLEELVMPLSYHYPSVAAGTNFKEHAEEIYSDDPPFLFPKVTEAGNWNEGVPFLPRLDFEAELCMFPLADIESADSLSEYGLVLCNDFTDRWTLLKELDLGEPLGLTGFASGKGCEKCLPTGYLLVVPRAPDFYLSLDLSLYVNDELRQRFRMADVILPIEEIVSRSFEHQKTDYRRGNERVSLLPHGYIPKGTLMLTGTAAGVLFKPANIWNQGFYLQAGDVVRTEATYLGHLENTVEAP
jgi:2-keto-4-pentenoate hydratase/2-oxohepta-3-ene-1,7-dioic acid hydratase in catechol pathway